MLFMDALELDHHDTTTPDSPFIPDLLPGHLDRELMKAYIAFSSGEHPYREVVTGLWGCRAFGGNKEIKVIVQWCAASIADVPVVFVCSGEKEFLGGLRRFVTSAAREDWRVTDVLELLRGLGPTDEDGVSSFQYILRQLSRPADKTTRDG
jgi:poly(ADP-ribose) glycohydrolase